MKDTKTIDTLQIALCDNIMTKGLDECAIQTPNVTIITLLW